MRKLRKTSPTHLTLFNRSDGAGNLGGMVIRERLTEWLRNSIGWGAPQPSLKKFDLSVPETRASCGFPRFERWFYLILDRFPCDEVKDNRGLIL